MASLTNASPILARDVEAALKADGRHELVEQVRTLPILKCTFSGEYDVGYVYFRTPPFPVPAVHNEAAVVAETISLGSYDLCIDLDHEGNVFGIEYIGRGDISNELRSFAAHSR